MKKFNINKFEPCKEGLDYYNSQPDAESAWNNCEMGEWMLWIAKKLQVDDRIFTLAKANCANTVRHLMKDQRSIDAVDAAIKHGNGEISRGELNKFAYDASASAYGDYASAAAYAASASVYAYSAAAAAYAAYAYASAYASAAAYDAAKKENQKQTADVCRKYLTEEIFKLI